MLLADGSHRKCISNSRTNSPEVVRGKRQVARHKIGDSDRRFRWEIGSCMNRGSMILFRLAEPQRCSCFRIFINRPHMHGSSRRVRLLTVLTVADSAEYLIFLTIRLISERDCASQT